MKRAYMKGEIKRVKLVPEEAVLMACKGDVFVGPGGMGCRWIGGEPCQYPGS